MTQFQQGGRKKKKKKEKLQANFAYLTHQHFSLQNTAKVGPPASKYRNVNYICYQCLHSFSCYAVPLGDSFTLNPLHISTHSAAKLCLLEIHPLSIHFISPLIHLLSYDSWRFIHSQSISDLHSFSCYAIPLGDLPASIHFVCPLIQLLRYVPSIPNGCHCKSPPSAVMELLNSCQDGKNTSCGWGIC
jgi:hypothetical protein